MRERTRAVLKECVEEIELNRVPTREWSARTHEDNRIASEVRGLLETQGHVPFNQVRVVSENGRVDLSGEVSWLRQIRKAEEAILALPGVSEVTNSLTVKPYASAVDLKARIVNALVARAHRVANRVTVETRDGTVTLRGTVSSRKYRELAVRVAESTPGVRRVEDRIKVGAPG